MVVENSITTYNTPDYNDIGSEWFKAGDTLLFVESNPEKEMVKVKSKNLTAWINEYYFIPEQISNFDDFENNDYIVDYEKFISTASQISDIEFEKKFNTPEAKIINNNLTKSIYRNIILVKDKKYYYTFWLIYENGKFLKDSLIGEGEAKWIEKIPLAGSLRKILPDNLLPNAKNSKFSKYI